MLFGTGQSQLLNAYFLVRFRPLSNIHHTPGQPQCFRPKGERGINGLHDLAQLAHEFVNLTFCDHQRRGHLQHLKVVTANLRANAFVTKVDC
jgi:hypothetical protein